MVVHVRRFDVEDLDIGVLLECAYFRQIALELFLEPQLHSRWCVKSCVEDYWKAQIVTCLPANCGLGVCHDKAGRVQLSLLADVTRRHGAQGSNQSTLLAAVSETIATLFGGGGEQKLVHRS